MDLNEEPDTGIALEVRKRSKSSEILDSNEEPDTGIALEVRKRSKSSVLLDFNEDPDTGIALSGSVLKHVSEWRERYWYRSRTLFL